MTRFILEGEWSGYTSSQQRVVHREIINNKRAERLRQLHKIVYTDGTSLMIRVREAEYREKIKLINSYGELIRDAEKHGGSVVRVADLCEETV
ncbi:hypothetical protein [Bradyrhizobium sp. URHD0069]|uniref:hypothetical protein n=1 Tax=Bradyrhizobium sp. URHD0069 TaxID=1380355 RepID=UPI000495167B|nr:hypothetical protein [Bradyrhizobium sp. URHD0069]